MMGCTHQAIHPNVQNDLLSFYGWPQYSLNPGAVYRN